MNISQAEVARRVDMTPSNLIRFLKRKSIDTMKLFGFCVQLKYNFFEEFCGRKDVRDYSDGYRCPVVNVGQSIEKRLLEMELSQKDLADMLKSQQSAISRIIKKDSIDTDKLIEISKVLNYNFFEEFCAEVVVKKETPKVSSEFEELLKHYEQVIIENQQLKKENMELKAKIYELSQLK